LKLLDERRWDLSKYRLEQAKESLKASKLMMENDMIKDAINRSYYAAFYALKAVLAIEGKDFKRHKDVVAYFNQMYVATGIFPRELGRMIAKLQQLREKSDYDDFFIVCVVYIYKIHHFTALRLSTLILLVLNYRKCKQAKLSLKKL
jgi:uncharacterized protein (UPF0332 family)